MIVSLQWQASALVPYFVPVPSRLSVPRISIVNGCPALGLAARWPLPLTVLTPGMLASEVVCSWCSWWPT